MEVLDATSAGLPEQIRQHTLDIAFLRSMPLLVIRAADNPSKSAGIFLSILKKHVRRQKISTTKSG